MPDLKISELAATTELQAGDEIPVNRGGANLKVTGAMFPVAMTLAEPADGDFATGDVKFWFDASTGAAKLMIKALDDADVFVFAEIALAP
jgi:hypothetical protein